MKILVPTAGPVPAQQNVEYIVDIAKRLKAELDVIHILDLGEYDGGRNALEIFDQAGEKAGVAVNTYIQEGNVVPTIIDYASELEIDLIIIGASGGNLVADWIVTQILDKVTIPVVIIPYMLASQD